MLDVKIGALLRSDHRASSSMTREHSQALSRKQATNRVTEGESTGSVCGREVYVAGKCMWLGSVENRIAIPYSKHQRKGMNLSTS